MDSLVAKAAILQEALPYIRRFHNQTVVVKYGGHAMADPELQASFARDVCLLRYVGIRVLVVHGGGPQINDALIAPGHPVQLQRRACASPTTPRWNVVEMVLAGRVNPQIVGLLGAQGGRAIGLSGRTIRCSSPSGWARCTTPAKAPTIPRSTSVASVASRASSRELLENLVSNGLIPVIAPIAIDAEGKPLNVNADTAAGEIADRAVGSEVGADDRRRGRQGRQGADSELSGRADRAPSHRRRVSSRAA